MAVKTEQRVIFNDLADRPVHVEFTAPDQSSDTGVLLLEAIDRKMGLSQAMAAAVRDRREPGKVRHSVHAMFQERILGIGCGYPDTNDAGRFNLDPAMLLACDRRDASLASQPTLSRFENSATPGELLRMGYALTQAVLDAQSRRRKRRQVRHITIDMDPTEDRTYGRQQWIAFNGYYDAWCYLPMITTIQFDEEPEHYAIAPLLRRGNAPGSEGALAILKRLLPELRGRFPKAVIRVRMDGAFATPEVFDWLETNRLGYVINMAKNEVLERLARPWMQLVQSRAKASQVTEKVYAETNYQAGKWTKARRTIIKAEVVGLPGRALRDNPRFAITNLPWTPENVYGFYAKRGDVENRIKELKDGLRLDLTSCSRFGANQFRILLTMAAYVLYQQLRYEARGTDCARAQVPTLRERLIKLAGTVAESVRRILIEAPKAYVWLTTWRVVAARVGATP